MTTTALEKMVFVQADYFIKKFNYEIEIIVKQNSDDSKPIFEINKNIKLNIIFEIHNVSAIGKVSISKTHLVKYPDMFWNGYFRISEHEKFNVTIVVVRCLVQRSH